jgi:hypothetical protein
MKCYDVMYAKAPCAVTQRANAHSSDGRGISADHQAQPRNSRAEANVSGCQPSQRISNSSDSRTERLSETTNTTGLTRDIRLPGSGQTCVGSRIFNSDNSLMTLHSQGHSIRDLLNRLGGCHATFAASAYWRDPIPRYRRYHRLIVLLQRFCFDYWRRPIQLGTRIARNSRSRDRDCSRPPPRIRTGGFPASGSCLR